MIYTMIQDTISHELELNLIKSAKVFKVTHAEKLDDLMEILMHPINLIECVNH